MDPARARSFACGVEAAAFLNEHSLSGAEALDYVLEIAAERQCDPVLALIWVDRHLADPSASRELRAAARRHPMFGSRKSSVVVAGDFAYKVISHSPLRVRLWTTHGGPEEASGPLAAQIAQEVAVAGSNRRELRQTLEGAWYVLSRRTKRQRQETGGGQRNLARAKDRRFWTIIDQLGWGTKSTDSRKLKRWFLANISPAQAEEFRDEFHTRVGRLSRIIQDDWEVRTGKQIPVSDDSYSDLLAHIIGLGEFETSRVERNPKHAYDRAKAGKYTESFKYVIPSESDYKTEELRRCALLLKAEVTAKRAKRRAKAGRKKTKRLRRKRIATPAKDVVKYIDADGYLLDDEDGQRNIKNSTLRRMTLKEWKRKERPAAWAARLSPEQLQFQEDLILRDWSRPERMFDYAQYGWTQQPLVAFANEVVTIPATDFYPSSTRKKGYSDYAVIGGVAFAVGRKGNNMTLDYVDNKTGKVRTGRAVYHTQSAVMKRVSKVAGIANPGQQWPSKSFEYQGGSQRNITTRQRRLMPQSDFGLPIKSQSPGFRATHPKFAGAYPMQDRSHAANARGRAVQMLNSGHLSLREARIIFARTSSKWGFADKDLVRIDGRWKSVPAARRRRAAANH